MSESDEGEMQSIATRISRLNQLFMGRSSQSITQTQASHESLLDALLALYDECNSAHFLRNQYIAGFVNKYTKTVKELRSLRISINDFNIKNTIGRGHFGEVQVVREKNSGDVYALKVLRKADTLAQQNVAFYEEERDIMAKSSSCWITQLQYAFQDAQSLYLVMEFHPGGDLLSLLARFDDVFEEKMVRFYLAEMVLALHSLHSMGYVHRDVKPENILIDRTGHIKLADFGSACKLAVSTASVSNMPVGTPDYICPEVLLKMNSSQTSGKFGAECDWWSIGVCAYEMLYGKTPFTDESGSMVVTYANIMNHKKCLKFPPEGDVSPAAIDLMGKLLTDATSRLKYEQICVHRFFADIDFDNIRQVTPPFIPTVTSNDDTSNFDEFEKVKRGPNTDDFSKKNNGFTGKDLPFVGFTFTKKLFSNERPSLSTEVSSPAAKASIERRLNLKSRELTDLREKYKEMEHKHMASNSELNRLRNQLGDRDSRIDKLEAERRTLELDKAHYMTEVKSLSRLLEMEKQDRQQTEDKAMNLLEDIRKQSEVAQELRDQTNKQDLDEHKEVICQLEDENHQLSDKIARLEHNLAEETAAHYDAMAKIDLLKSKVSDLKQSIREQGTTQSDREVQLQAELDKANQQRYEAVELLSTMRQSKTRLEEELYALRRKSNMEDVLMSRLSDAEDTRQMLETQVHRLELVEKREESLRQQLNEKSKHVTQLAERIADLEELNQEMELDQAAETKLTQQREGQLKERIHELEEMLNTLREERSTLEEQSFILSDQQEEKLKKIYEQEETISLLKSNVSKLESQILTMRTDLEESQKENISNKHLSGVKTPTTSPHKVRSRRSGFCQTDTPPWKTLRQHGQRTEETQTDLTPPAKRSIEEDFSGSPKKQSYGVQVKLDDSFVSPRRKKSNQAQTDFTPRRSNNTQTEATSMDVPCQQRSSNTQTDRVTRRSNNMQTEVRVKVSMCTSPDSSTSEERSVSPHQESEISEDSVLETCPQESPNTTDTSEGSLNSTVIYCGGGDALKSKRSSRKLPGLKEESHDEKKPKNREQDRRTSEQVSDLLQEKAYLEMRIENLSEEIAQYKESAHEQRIRALDLKIELREKTGNMEKEIAELKEKLNSMELSLSQAQESSAKSVQKEATLKERFERLQTEYDSSKIENRRKISDLQVERDDLDTQVNSLKSRMTLFEAKEDELRQYKSRSQELGPKVKDLQEYTDRLEARLLLVTDINRIEDLETQLATAQVERTKFRIEMERARDELQQKKRDYDQLNLANAELKKVAEDLDNQLQEYEALSDQYEKKATKWSHHKTTYEKAVDEREKELEDTHRQLTKQTELREHEEARMKSLENQLDTLRTSSKSKVENLQHQVNEAREKMKTLAEQLTALERTNSHLEVDLNTTKRHLETSNSDNIRLKEEISTLITSVSELKASNLKVSKALEEAMDRYELLASQNTDLQNQQESHMANFNHEKYKLQSTINQQTKLIDYLQCKVENPPRKKKGLFGSKRIDNAAATTGIQFRELQHSLEHERDKNSNLRQTITRLQTELYQKQADTISQRSCQENVHLPTATALETLALSPASQPSPRVFSTSATYCTPKVNGGGSRPKKERMHHNIPHRFVTGLNSRATKCAVCLGSIHFVTQAAKCQECNVVCHPKCAPSLPASCGLPTEYASHFSDMMTRARSSSRLSVADLRLTLNAWMKIPRPGKQLWEKKWVVLMENEIHIFNDQDTTADHVEEFELCPGNGTVTVHSAVTAAELTNTASSDLPYILRLEFEPETTCWPGRSLYLMALSFEDKQKWVATLEGIVDHSHNSASRKEAKLIGNTILSISGERRPEINCTLPLYDQYVLVGADEGLYVMDLSRSTTSQSLSKVTGVNCVYQMEVIKSLNMVVMLTGRERQVVLVGQRELEMCVGAARPSITPYPIPDALACTTLSWGIVSGTTYLCAALAEKIQIYMYDDHQEAFELEKELLTAQACSCTYFGKRHVIVGTDKFYKIDLHSYGMSDLLDKHDASLAFAAFGAAHYHSFPIAILQVAPPEEANEYLLCYHEFGIFVDSTGRRSRDDDMKWSGLPLAFAYRQPYLYIIHFNAVQVVEIPESHYHHSSGSKTMLNLVSPRYLGEALTNEAVYIGSNHNDTTEILCFKGNMFTRTEEKEPVYAQPMKKSKSSSRCVIVESSSVESGFLSPEEMTSPPAIRQLDHSPKSSLSRRKMNKIPVATYSSTSSDTDDHGAPPGQVTVGVSIHARSRGRKRYSDDSSDISS